MRPRVVAWLYPYIGPLAGWVVPTYVSMLAFGSLLAAIYVVEMSRRAGFRTSVVLRALMFAYVGGLIGAAAVPLVQGLVRWLLGGPLSPPTGMAAYGGLIGGTLSAAYAIKQYKYPVMYFLDISAPAIGIGYFFARLGCFLAGCDFGTVTNVPWAVEFPRQSHAYIEQLRSGAISPDSFSSLPVHPTQLYLSFVGLFLYSFVSLFTPRTDGRRFWIYTIGYAASRSIVEEYRGDVSRGFVGPLSTSQFFALTTVLVGFAHWYYMKYSSQAAS